MLERIASLLKIQPPAPAVSGLLMVSGTTLPTDGDAGYATGCLFQKTDGGDGSALYVNEGDETSADFNLITVA